MKNMFLKTVTIAVAAMFFACTASAQTPKKGAKQNEVSNSKNYYFEPKVSTITGTVQLETFYNEAAGTERHYVLVLSSPVNVIASSEDEYDFTARNLSKIQLTGSQLVNYKNKKVRITGTFFGAVSAHHHTGALLEVTKVEVLP
jgi:hypothetical protein